MFYSKKFAPGTPNPKVARFTTGKYSTDYDYSLELVSRGKVQIRSNALESARVAVNKKLVTLGEENYLLRVVCAPLLVLRENKMIATAGADRLQEGMRKAFGKPIGVAARVGIGSLILELRVRAADLEKGKNALHAAKAKLPVLTDIRIEQLTKPQGAASAAAPTVAA